MIKIHIKTRNIGGDEELAAALRTIIEQIDEGEDSGRFIAPDADDDDDEQLIEWAVNSRNPAFLSDMEG